MQTLSSRTIARPAGSWCEVKAAGFSCGCDGNFSEWPDISWCWVSASHRGKARWVWCRSQFYWLSRNPDKGGWPRSEGPISIPYLLILYPFGAMRMDSPNQNRIHLTGDRPSRCSVFVLGVFSLSSSELLSVPPFHFTSSLHFSFLP